jgi:hypothetical protein
MVKSGGVASGISTLQKKKRKIVLTECEYSQKLTFYSLQIHRLNFQLSKIVHYLSFLNGED